MSEQLPESTLFHVDLSLTRDEFRVDNDPLHDDFIRNFIRPAVNCLRNMRAPLPEKIKLVLLVMPE